MVQSICAVSCVLVFTVSLSGCSPGGLSAPPQVPTAEIEPPEGYLSWPSTRHPGIGSDGRRDYREAMYDDCIELRDNSSDCSISGRGWFYPWESWPSIVQPKNRTDLESIAVRRAIMVLNRSLPEDKRFGIDWEWISEQVTMEGISRENAYEWAAQTISPGHIHAEVFENASEEFRGYGGTDGAGRGVAVLDASDFDLSNLYDLRWAVDVMVHEFLHALGFLSHPHAIHTSILSYRHHREGELDSLPLVDVAVLYDMYGWGSWSETMKLVVDTVDGVQFGVHNLHDGTAVIPWVDAGYMAGPSPNALLGSASYTGGLAGYTASGLLAEGDTRLSVNFNTGSGSAQFDKIQAHDGTTWNMWSRLGFDTTSTCMPTTSTPAPIYMIGTASRMLLERSMDGMEKSPLAHSSAQRLPRRSGRTRIKRNCRGDTYTQSNNCR